MEKQETGLLDQAIEGVERLIVRHCELVDAALRMSAQVQAAPACGRIEVLEDMKEGRHGSGREEHKPPHR